MCAAVKPIQFSDEGKQCKSIYCITSKNIAMTGCDKIQVFAFPCDLGFECTKIRSGAIHSVGQYFH